MRFSVRSMPTSRVLFPAGVPSGLRRHSRPSAIDGGRLNNWHDAFCPRKHSNFHAASQRPSLRSFSVCSASVDFPSLVSPEWLKSRMQTTTVKILDGSWYMPNAGRDPAAEFKTSRVPGAAFFDMDQISDKSSNLPHMLPSPQSFSAAADALGISKDTDVVVYDGSGIFSAARVWWTFKVFGHDRVAVLNGGFPGWKSAGYDVDESQVVDEVLEAPVKAANSPVDGANYAAALDQTMMRSFDEVLGNIDTGREQLIDARPAARFAGSAPEPRPGTKSGHAPGSLNVPFSSVLTPEGQMRPVEELKKIFQTANVDFDKPIIASCGSGVTACVLLLALHQLQIDGKQVSLYDGSWSEWGARTDTPILTKEVAG